jgi:hypothetical protein
MKTILRRVPKQLSTGSSGSVTFNATAGAFDHSALDFRGYFGGRAVERLALGREARVLDVCCGTG